MDVAVLLGQLGSHWQLDVDASGCDVSEVCAEVAHESLSFEAGGDTRLHLGIRRFLVTLVVHGRSCGSWRLGIGHRVCAPGEEPSGTVLSCLTVFIVIWLTARRMPGRADSVVVYSRS